MKISFFLIFAFNTLSWVFAKRGKIEADSDGDTKEVNDSPVGYGGRFDMKSVKQSFEHENIKSPPHIIPSGVERDAVKRRTRRMVFRTKCIPKVKNFCKRFTVKGITKLFCLKLKVSDCTALD